MWKHDENVYETDLLLFPYIYVGRKKASQVMINSLNAGNNFSPRHLFNMRYA